jgi:integrase
MLYQGLRKEEVLALNIDRDIDFENNLLYVREAMSYSTTHRGKIEQTKTEKGTRCMPLFKPVRDVLQGMHGLLVKPVNAEQMTDSAFQSIWKSYKHQMGVLHNNGLRPRWDENGEFDPITIRTHDFRHSFCTMICEAGVDIKTAMIWMGHADEKMILRIYDHVGEKRTQNSVKQVEKMLNGMQNGMQNASHEA